MPDHFGLWAALAVFVLSLLSRAFPSFGSALTLTATILLFAVLLVVQAALFAFPSMAEFAVLVKGILTRLLDSVSR